MPFPLTALGTVTVPCDDPNEIERFIRSVQRALGNVEATKIHRDGQSIHFHAGLLPSWNLLTAVTDGDLTFSHEPDGLKIAYRITFTQTLVIISVMVTTLLVFGVIMAKEMPAPSMLFFIPIGSLFLFTPSYLITIFRFPRFLRRSVNLVQPVRILPPSAHLQE
jgi:hypothetical protein